MRIIQTNIKKDKAVIKLSNCKVSPIESLLNKYHLSLQIIENQKEIPGSFWGDSEAGLIKNLIFIRKDSPIHSMLHEACHYICMDSQRRDSLHTDAAGDYDEENAVCYLQILLANEIPEMGSNRMMQDMDSWGYTFRLGSAQAWFENDAEDALSWLRENKILDKNNLPNYHLRA